MSHNEPVIKGSDIATEVAQNFINSIDMEFVYIPPGTFMMGSPSQQPGRYYGETQHQV